MTKGVLVTGAGRGIGRAIAELFAQRGAAVVVADVDSELANETTARIIEAGGTADAFTVDIADDDAVSAMVAFTIDRFSELTVAINNAGILGPMSAIHAVEEADFDRTFSVNLTGTWSCMRHEIPALLARGGGTIVNVASINGIRAVSNGSIYSATKAGVIGLTRTAALEYGGHGIRINALCPGATDTDMLKASMPNPAALQSIIPQGRFADSKEIAQAAYWLCSDEASYVNGQTLLVDGGVMVQ